jgi:hypothetical protein
MTLLLTITFLIIAYVPLLNNLIALFKYGNNRWKLSVGFDRPLKLAPGTNLLKLLISSRGRSIPIDRFRRIPKLGSYRIL